MTSSIWPPSNSPVPRMMAFLMLSAGMLTDLAARMAVRRRGLASGSPPLRAAMEISLMTRVNVFPRLASSAAFLCLDRLAPGIYQLWIAYLEARFLQELYALPQVGAHSFGIAADRIDVRRGENVGRHLIADRLENFQLQPLGQAGCGKLGSLEIAVDALVLPIEQLLVHLLEI